MTFGQAEGQEELLDVNPLDLVHPDASATTVVDWLTLDPQPPRPVAVTGASMRRRAPRVRSHWSSTP